MSYTFKVDLGYTTVEVEGKPGYVEMRSGAIRFQIIPEDAIKLAHVLCIAASNVAMKTVKAYKDKIDDAPNRLAQES